MSIKSLDIGASASSRTDASNQVDGVFSSVTFPVQVVFTSNSPIPITLPEIGLSIKSGDVQSIEVKSLALLKCSVASIAQIAKLRSVQKIMTISIDDEIETSEEEALGAVTVVQELGSGNVLVKLNGITFTVKKIQIRSDKTLTAGGVAAYLAAKNESA